MTIANVRLRLLRHFPARALSCSAVRDDVCDLLGGRGVVMNLGKSDDIHFPDGNLTGNSATQFSAQFERIVASCHAPFCRPLGTLSDHTLPSHA